jgi:hypothetical protein
MNIESPKIRMYYSINRIFPANPPWADLGQNMSFTPISSIADSQKSLFGIEAGVRLVLLQKAWDQHLPSPVRDNTYPGAVSPEGIIIRTSRQVWQRQCTFLLPEIREAIKAIAPDLALLPILIRLEKPFKKPSFKKNKSIELTEELREQAMNISNLSNDPQIRKACYPLILKSLLTGKKLGFPSILEKTGPST